MVNKPSKNCRNHQTIRQLFKTLYWKYELKEEGLIINVQFKDNEIFITNTPIGNLNLLPMKNTKFIDIESGTAIEFLVDDKMNRFMINNSFELVKIVY